jgi:hypothetical protein
MPAGLTTYLCAMVFGLFRALIATFLIGLVLVVTVPKHYVHTCEHEHAEQAPLDADHQETKVLADHHCAICELIISSYNSGDANELVLVPSVSISLLVLAPANVDLERLGRSADRGPPAHS